MRIIEPKRPRSIKKSVQRRRLVTVLVALLIGSFVLIAGVAVYAFTVKTPRSSPKKTVSAPQQTSAIHPSKVASKPKTELRTLTAQQFEDLYNKFAYPNTDEIIDQPTITGNVEADQRIRDIALARGYRLRSIPKSPMPELGEFTFQQLAMNDFKKLKQSAADAGMGIGIAAAFRSPEDQRDIFVGRMQAAGVAPEDIAAGRADAAVNSLLAVTAIPGYSRHHTGYTLDLECGGWEVFASSPCFTWLSENNYYHAKVYGWIPSYPDGIANQGPDPEPWEYVWVGTDVLYE